MIRVLVFIILMALWFWVMDPIAPRYPWWDHWKNRRKKRG